MTHPPALTDGRERAGVIRHGVISEQTANADAAPTKPSERPLQKGRTRGRIRGAEYFRISQPGRIIDRHVEIFPADTTSAPAAITMDAMPNLRHAAHALQIDVQEIAGLGPFVALHRRRGLKEREAIEAPLGDRAHANPNGRGNPRIRPAVLGPVHDQLAHLQGGLRVTMNSHFGSASRDNGKVW